MHLRRKKASWLHSAADRVSDPGWRHDIVDKASDTAAQLAGQVARRSNDLGSQVGGIGSQVGERMSEVAHNVSDEARTLVADIDLKPRRHRLRRLIMVSGIGAIAAYFLDPENGIRRRASARRRTSTAARHLGNGLERAAHAAHQAADAAGTDAPMGSASTYSATGQYRRDSMAESN